MSAQDQVQAVPIRDKTREKLLQDVITLFLLNHLNGGTTIAELEMLSGHVFDLIDSWNRNGKLPHA